MDGSVVKQLQYYFTGGLAQLKKVRNAQGWVPLEKLVQFRKMSNLLESVDDKKAFLLDALAKLECVEVEDDVRQKEIRNLKGILKKGPSPSSRADLHVTFMLPEKDDEHEERDDAQSKWEVPLTATSAAMEKLTNKFSVLDCSDDEDSDDDYRSAFGKKVHLDTFRYKQIPSDRGRRSRNRHG